ncbi:MAG: hypothetical protein MUF01_04575 [Bryobacterales bacterium]|jgi:hypothetical protein|nr:hypothetical protein [Bryobacterales bacterium]
MEEYDASARQPQSPPGGDDTLQEAHDTQPARDPDEVLSPEPFRDPNDFAPLPPPRASLRDLLELAGHIVFVVFITVVIPITVLWAMYRLYRWLPMETMALGIAGLAAAWAYRDRLGGRLRRALVGRDR